MARALNLVVVALLAVLPFALQWMDQAFYVGFATRLLIYAQQPPAANADAMKYLRALQVVRLDTLSNGQSAWVAVGDPEILPEPICVVPPSPVPAA